MKESKDNLLLHTDIPRNLERERESAKERENTFSAVLKTWLPFAVFILLCIFSHRMEMSL